MNSKSINNVISKELGLRKSEIILGTRQICNRSGICYAYGRTKKYSGDFHCKKQYGKAYNIRFDSFLADEVKNDIVELLVKLECTDVENRGYYIYFKIPTNN